MLIGLTDRPVLVHDGLCPIVVPSTPERSCSTEVKNTCSQDGDCDESAKCCQNECGERSCHKADKLGMCYDKYCLE